MTLQLSFRSSLLPELLARVFVTHPTMPVWQWADENVWLTGQMAAVPGPYDSSKTPWTRRMQDIIGTGRDPRTGKRVRQYTAMKSSQSGFTEGVLNAIRYRVRFAPCNVVYVINSMKKARDINEMRVLPSLRRLGEDILGNDEDKITGLKLTLPTCVLWFYGSGASGDLASNQATIIVCDEVEEHQQQAGDTSTTTNALSRMKTAEDGVFVLISKPKLAGGIIDREFQNGNCEEWMVPCPHCDFRQALLTENLVFSHCKDLLGQWDKARLLEETWVKCQNPECGLPIEERHKQAMGAQGEWVATNPVADPEHVSQHVSDLLSPFPDARWGRLALRIIAAAGDMSEKQGIRNHVDGLPWAMRASKTEKENILALRRAYRRGHIPIPFMGRPFSLLGGSDIGMDHARWAVVAFARDGEAWLIDWGSEQAPVEVVDLMWERKWDCGDGDPMEVEFGLMDAKYRKEEVYQACLGSRGIIYPSMGAGVSRRSINFTQLPQLRKGFGVFTYADDDAKHHLYNERIADPTEPPALWLPENIDETLITELCNETLQRQRVIVHGREYAWKRTGPNHYGDCLKVIFTAWKYIQRQMTDEQAAAEVLTPPSE